MKSTVDEIRERFDNDVERFSQLDTGQSSAMDSVLAMEVITATAAAVTPNATHLLDVGCGAGNYTLKLLERLPGLDVTLVDLSWPMLDRAQARIGAAESVTVTAIQSDVRDVELPAATFDVIVAAAVLHHLRTDTEWETVLTKLYQALAPGGSLWIYDLVASDLPAVQTVLRQRWAAYLRDLGGDDYRERVFAYVEKEDTPRSLIYQLELLSAAGFETVEVLHKNACFAAFGAVK